jgi:hypothetical protein
MTDMTLRRSVLALSTVLLATACPGSPSGESATASESESADETASESETAGDETCIEGPELGPAVTITLRNQGSEPILVANTLSSECWGDTVPVTIADAEGELLWRMVTGQWSCAWVAGGGTCDYECGALQASLCLEPGATHEWSWAASAWSPMATPAACDGGGGCPQCFVEQPIAAGSVTISARAQTTTACECATELDEGGCLSAEGPWDLELEQSAVIDYPGETTVELTFE